jgi:hypothetical protein
MTATPMDRETPAIRAILAGVEGVSQLAEALDHVNRLLNELDAELAQPVLADGNLKSLAWLIGRAVLDVRLAACPESM